MQQYKRDRLLRRRGAGAETPLAVRLSDLPVCVSLLWISQNRSNCMQQALFPLSTSLTTAYESMRNTFSPSELISILFVDDVFVEQD